MDNNNKQIFKYFKVGDIIKDCPDSTWGETNFVIQKFFGNRYLPLVYVLQFGKPDTNRHKCNFDLRGIRLVDAPNRPFRNLDKTKLLKLVAKGIVEAKREFKIRVNNKEL